MTDRNKRFALLSAFDKFYKERYGQAPSYNKWSEQWAADAIIQSYGYDGAISLLEHYCKIAQNLDWKYFSNHAEEIRIKIESYERDLKERAERRERAKEWLSE